jgi:membrane AbrB-like protein
MTAEPWRIPLLTFGIAAVGAGLTYAVSFPAPFLTGPAIAVTLAGLAGIRTAAPPQGARDVVFIILGLTIGQGVTPEVLDAMRTWPVTLTALAASILAIILLTRAALVRYWSMDPTTAFLSSSPGHLSYVLGLTEGVKADLKTVSIVQSIRVLALTLLVPAAIALTGQLPERPAIVPEETALVPLVLMILCAAVVGYFLHRLKLPAAYLIGGMLVSVGLHVTGIVEGVMSYWLAAAAFVSLGALIGSRFSGVTLRRNCAGR